MLSSTGSRILRQMLASKVLKQGKHYPCALSVAKIRVLSTNGVGSGNNHSTIKQETTTTDKNIAAKSTSNHDTRRKAAKQNYDATARKPNQKCDPYGQNGKPLEYEEASKMMKTTALEPGWKIQSFTMINNNKTENENDNNCSSSLYNHPLCLTKEFHHADFMQGSKFLSKIAAVGHINNHFPYLKLERRLTKKSWDVVCVVTCFTAPLEGLSFNDFHIAMLIDVEVGRPEVKRLYLNT